MDCHLGCTACQWTVTWVVLLVNGLSPGLYCLSLDCHLGCSACQWTVTWVVLLVNALSPGLYCLSMDCHLDCSACQWTVTWVVLLVNGLSPGLYCLSMDPAFPFCVKYKSAEILGTKQNKNTTMQKQRTAKKYQPRRLRTEVELVSVLPQHLTYFRVKLSSHLVSGSAGRLAQCIPFSHSNTEGSLAQCILFSDTAVLRDH